MPKKSNLLETMKPEQKSRVDLEQVSLGCNGPWLTDPRFYQEHIAHPVPSSQNLPGRVGLIEQDEQKDPVA